MSFVHVDPEQHSKSQLTDLQNCLARCRDQQNRLKRDTNAAERYRKEYHERKASTVTTRRQDITKLRKEMEASYSKRALSQVDYNSSCVAFLVAYQGYQCTYEAHSANALGLSDLTRHLSVQPCDQSWTVSFLKSALAQQDTLALKEERSFLSKIETLETTLRRARRKQKREREKQDTLALERDKVQLKLDKVSWQLSYRRDRDRLNQEIADTALSIERLDVEIQTTVLDLESWKVEYAMRLRTTEYTTESVRVYKASREECLGQLKNKRITGKRCRSSHGSKRGSKPKRRTEVPV